MELEHLKQSEFDAHVALGTLRLSFVGMSNAGKSYRSKVLHRENDFLWYQVDEAIQKSLGFADMSEISSWLGMPTDKTYPEREAKYLELENEFTRQAAMQTNGKNFVFDTTGSVVHLTPETLRILKTNCLVVHLDVGEDSLDAMLEKFVREPKPVAWCGYLTLSPGESPDAALKRSYPKLLRDRLAMYRTLAHINITAAEVRDLSGTETLEVIKAKLPR